MPKSPKTKLQGKCGAWEEQEAVSKRIPEGLHAVTEGKDHLSEHQNQSIHHTPSNKKVHLFLLAVPNGLQDLSFLTRDLSHAPCSGSTKS